ncbi:unnamed protein product [Ectocarpus sp. CCAP 1310/34]|nr:unnamed protein product [Ectocarpus sp. CCAP 1310/34]
MERREHPLRSLLGACSYIFNSALEMTAGPPDGSSAPASPTSPFKGGVVGEEGQNYGGVTAAICGDNRATAAAGSGGQQGWEAFNRSMDGRDEEVRKAAAGAAAGGEKVKERELPAPMLEVLKVALSLLRRLSNRNLTAAGPFASTMQMWPSGHPQRRDWEAALAMAGEPPPSIDAASSSSSSSRSALAPASASAASGSAGSGAAAASRGWSTSAAAAAMEAEMAAIRRHGGSGGSGGGAGRGGGTGGGGGGGGVEEEKGETDPERNGGGGGGGDGDNNDDDDDGSPPEAGGAAAAAAAAAAADTTAGRSGTMSPPQPQAPGTPTPMAVATPMAVEPPSTPDAPSRAAGSRGGSGAAATADSTLAEGRNQSSKVRQGLVIKKKNA